jgi:hypothetical protein
MDMRVMGLLIGALLLNASVANAEECIHRTPTCVEHWTYNEAKLAAGEAGAINQKIVANVYPALANLLDECERSRTAAEVAAEECNDSRMVCEDLAIGNEKRCKSYCDGLYIQCNELVAGCEENAGDVLAACEGSLAQCEQAAQSCDTGFVLPLTTAPTEGSIVDAVNVFCAKAKIVTKGNNLKINCKKD